MPFWNSDKEDDEAKADNDRKSAIAVNAKHAPKFAQHGSYCRTRAVLNPQSGSSAYLEGHQLAGGKWQINRVTLINLGGEEEKIARQTKPIQFDTSFYGAMSKLGLYEGADAKNQFTGETVEELGDKHFKVFGQREGLVFDAWGMPHVIVNGSVLTQGQFIEEDYQKALTMAQNHANDDEASVQAAPVSEDPGGDIIAGLMPELDLAAVFNAEVEGKSVKEALEAEEARREKLASLRRTSKLFVKLNGNLERVQNAMPQILQRPTRHQHEYRDNIFLPDKYWSVLDCYLGVMYGQKKKDSWSDSVPMSEIMDALKQEGIDTKNIEKSCREIEMVCNVLYAQALFLCDRSRDWDRSKRNRKYFGKHKKRAHAIAKDLGKSQDDRDAIDLVIESGQEPEPPTEFVGAVLGKLEAVHKSVLALIEELDPPPPPPEPEKPKKKKATRSRKR